MQTTSSRTPQNKVSTRPNPRIEEIPKAGTQAGNTLKAEALGHLQDRRWKDSIRIAQAAQQLRPADPELHSMVAVAAAYLGKHGLCHQETSILQTLVEDETRSDSERANGYVALSSVRLAQGRFSEADRQARKALAFDSQHQGAWWHLTAGFAGLGWFEQSGQCLPLARHSSSHTSASPSNNTAIDADTSNGTDSNKPGDKPLAFAQWEVGRSINTWAMSKAPTWVVAVVGIILFGVLGLALAASTPFVVREIRVMRLDAQWRELAESVWRTEHRLRIKHTLLTLAMICLWVMSIVLAPAI